MQVVALRREQRGDERLQPIAIVQILPRDRTGACVGIHRGKCELARGRAGDFAGYFLDGRRNVGQPLGKRVGRDVERQLGGFFQRRQHRVHALEAIDHFLDGAGQIVLRVAQTHIYVAVTEGLDFDEITEAEHHVLVAVADQDVEVGVDDRRFVAARHLERCRPDAVGLVCLSLDVRILGRVNDLQLDHAARGDFVLLQHVPDARDQRREQWVGLFAEVAPDQQRLLQIGHQIPGGLRKRILPLCRQIQPQAIQREEPHVEQGHVQHHQERRESHAAPVGQRALPRAPSLAVERSHVERQERDGEREIVDQIAQIDHAALDALEVAARADGAQDLSDAVAEEIRHAARASQVEKATEQHAQNERDDLVVGARGYEEADGRVRRRQQEGSQVTADDRPPIQVPQHLDGDRQEDRQRQRDGDQRHHGQELARHQLDPRDRQCQQHLQRPGALLLAPLAHRQRRDEEDHQHRHPAEEWADVRNAPGEERIHPEERKQRGRQKHAHEDQRHWRSEVARQFFTCDG